MSTSGAGTPIILAHDLEPVGPGQVLLLAIAPAVGILGTVELAGVVRWFETGIVLTRCLSDDQTLYVLGSRWLVKGTKTAWLLRNPIKFETPIPATGSQGLWHLSTSLSEQVTALSCTEGLK